MAPFPLPGRTPERDARRASSGSHVNGTGPLLSGERTIFFCIHYHAPFGNQLRVAGSCRELGSWCLDQAIPMKWTAVDRWTGRVVLPANVLSFEYKYCEVSEDRLFVRWEGGKNRSIDLTNEGEFVNVIAVWESHVLHFFLNAQQGLSNFLLCGSNPHLGEWHEDRAIPMYPDRSGYGFSLTLAVPCWVKTVEYKYIRASGSERSKDTEWEKGTNHVMHLKECPSFYKIVDSFCSGSPSLAPSPTEE